MATPNPAPSSGHTQPGALRQGAFCDTEQSRVGREWMGGPGDLGLHTSVTPKLPLLGFHVDHSPSHLGRNGPLGNKNVGSLYQKWGSNSKTLLHCWEYKMAQPLVENFLAVSDKCDIHPPEWPSNSTLRYLLKSNENIAQNKLYKNVYCIIFVRAKNWKPCKCLSVGEWINKIIIWP